MLRFIFSVLLLASFNGFAQQQQELKVKNADTTTTVLSVKPKYDRYGLRVGVDAYRFARTFYEKGFKGLEVVADYRLTKKIYAAGEAGSVTFDIDDDRINFTAKGSYIKLGFDYNAYENWLDMNNMIYVGARYGFSTFSQRVNSYKVYQNSDVSSTDETDNYFDDVTRYPGSNFSGLSAHWLEVVGGVKAEVISNIFMGFSVRLNTLLANKKPAGFDNLYIPGFNRTYDGSFGVGINYTVSYFIPLYKKSASKKTDESKGGKASDKKQ